MFVYLFIAVIIFIFSLIELIVNDKEKQGVHFFEFMLCFLPLILLAAFRSVGFDYDSYEGAYDILHFTSFADIFSDVQFEVGYVLLNIISPSFLIVLFFMVLITLSIKYKFIVQISPYPIITIFFFYLAYFLNFEMGQIRQALAMSLAMYSIMYYNKNVKYVVFFILLAVLFHYSALIFLLVLFIPKRIKTWYFYVFCLLLAVCLYFTIEPLFIKLSDYLPGFSAAKVMTYYDDEKGQVGISLTLLSLKFLIIFLALSLKSKIIELGRPIYEYIFNLYFLSVFIYITFAFFPQVSGRAGVYFSIFDIVLIPIILKSITKSFVRLFTLILFAILYVSIFVRFLILWDNAFIPYKTWLF